MLPLPPAGLSDFEEPWRMPEQDAPPVTFTVFTPTFNRRETLARAYRSLCAQTFRDFEWLVVDDGSTDGTEELFASLVSEADFPIAYARQENAGKHVALNQAARAARGALLATLDSDDEYVPTALERFLWHWDTIPEPGRSGFAGVAGLCVDQAGEVIGTRFPADVLDSDYLEIRARYGVKGDKAGFATTASVLEFPFPELAGERFVTEALVYNRIARRYRVRFVNEVMMVKEYRPEGLSSRAKIVLARSPVSTRMYHAEAIAHGATGTQKLKHYANHVRFSLHAGLPSRPVGGSVFLWLGGFPIGLGLYLRERLALRRDSAIRS
jgi:glycosyltransferase involved in cell wall biosynthesis